MRNETIANRIVNIQIDARLVLDINILYYNFKIKENMLLCKWFMLSIELDQYINDVVIVTMMIIDEALTLIQIR